jgi:hypothetical protein
MRFSHGFDRDARDACILKALAGLQNSLEIEKLEIEKICGIGETVMN